MNMYERYCQLRDERGLRDSEVAAKLGFASSGLSDWKRGKSKPNVENLYKIAKLFDTTIEYLLTGEKTYTCEGN